MNFPIQRRVEVKNRSIITTPKRDDRHKNKKKTHIIVKSIHSSLRSESKSTKRGKIVHLVVKSIKNQNVERILYKN
jgi:hypothetical protein